MWHNEGFNAITPPPVIYDEANAILLKKLFAAAWVRLPDNPYEAARAVEQDPWKQQHIGEFWPHDTIVLQERERLLATLGPVAKVPSKEEFANEVYQAGRDAKSVSDKLNAWKFFADIMGYVERGGAGNGGTAVHINNIVGARIMAVPVAASDEDWEARAAAHSRMLMAKHG